MYYEEIAYLQFDYDTKEFEDLLENADDEAMLRLASEYDNGDDPDNESVYATCTGFGGDSVVVENERYVLVRNLSVGGTWTIFKKWKKGDLIKKLSQSKDYITRSEAINDLIMEVLAQWKPE